MQALTQVYDVARVEAIEIAFERRISTSQLHFPMVHSGRVLAPAGSLSWRSQVVAHALPLTYAAETPPRVFPGQEKAREQTHAARQPCLCIQY
ncbi:MAG: hypothetical protein JXA89_22150 [Anaerolineae bacterium]|nr:hypothetical protein [Anaerolineae bacterium]